MELIIKTAELSTKTAELSPKTAELMFIKLNSYIIYIFMMKS